MASVINAAAAASSRRNRAGPSSRSSSSGHHHHHKSPHLDSPARKDDLIIDSAVLMSLKNDDLLKGFGEVQRKLIHVLNAFGQSDNLFSFVESCGPVAVGVRTLREIAGALIEKDPHFACYNKIYEDLWLLGFSRPLKLSNKLEQGNRSLQEQNLIKEWRTWFMLDWHGYLSKLQDTLEMYQRPEPVLNLVPTLLDFLPTGYRPKGNMEQYQLPITYLLRDIALCIARIHSHINPQLEKFWMQRAMSINMRLKGRTYQEAYALIHEKPKKSAEKVEILGRLDPEVVLYDLDGPEVMQTGECDDDSVGEVETFEGKRGYESPVSEAGASSCLEDSEMKYGHLHATSKADLEHLKAFAGRNSFIQGLVAAAREQGFGVEDESDGERDDVG